MNPARVSVLMAVRDGEATLPAALTSLFRQSLTEHEVVVVDDGSVDASGEILDRWSLRDPRLRVVHLARAGLVPALNAGLTLCRAPLVARMDADDISHPRRLELQRALLCSRPDLGMASSLVRHFPWRGVGEGNRLYEAWLNDLLEPEQIRRERFVESPIAHPSVMLQLELVQEAGGYRDEDWPEDYDLWLRLLEAGVRCAKVPRFLLFWREHGDRLTRRDDRYSVQAFLRCKAHFLLRGPLAERPPVLLWGAGRTGRRLSRDLLAGGACIEAVVDIDPRRIGSTLHGVRIVAPDALPGLLAPDTVVLGAVASRGARQEIRERLRGFGLVEGDSFWCAA